MSFKGEGKVSCTVFGELSKRCIVSPEDFEVASAEASLVVKPQREQTLHIFCIHSSSEILLEAATKAERKG